MFGARSRRTSFTCRQRNPHGVRIISPWVHYGYPVIKTLASLSFFSILLASSHPGRENAVNPHPARPVDRFAVRLNNDQPRTMQAAGPTLVIGFLGGLLRRGDPIRSECKLAEHLRADHPEGVHVETFENRHHRAAHKTILRLLDTDHDGTLSNDEKRAARIILYGHSWGGAAVVHLAHDLQQEGIPVLLTLQVDSVGQHDEVIPSNVQRAANFFQPSGLVHGRPTIRAADPSHTKIIGNYRMDYKNHSIDCSDYPWYERALARTHNAIACDPSVWAHVEALIREELPAHGQR